MKENQKLKRENMCLVKECGTVEYLYEKFESLRGDYALLEKENQEKDIELKKIDQLKVRNPGKSRLGPTISPSAPQIRLPNLTFLGPRNKAPKRLLRDKQHPSD